jgi:hypothetical protein
LELFDHVDGHSLSSLLQCLIQVIYKCFPQPRKRIAADNDLTAITPTSGSQNFIGQVLALQEDRHPRLYALRRRPRSLQYRSRMAENGLRGLLGVLLPALLFPLQLVLEFFSSAASSAPRNSWSCGGKASAA